jgi:hypothetical protein
MRDFDLSQIQNEDLETLTQSQSKFLSVDAISLLSNSKIDHSKKMQPINELEKILKTLKKIYK